jgi:hypothetical protein
VRGHLVLGDGLGAVVLLERRDDRHRVTVAEPEVFSEPGDHLACLHAGLEQTPGSCQRDELLRRLAGLGLDVVEVRLH